jgi:hypothetical protein
VIDGAWLLAVIRDSEDVIRRGDAHIYRFLEVLDHDDRHDEHGVQDSDCKHIWSTKPATTDHRDISRNHDKEGNRSSPAK